MNVPVCHHMLTNEGCMCIENIYKLHCTLRCLSIQQMTVTQAAV